MKNTKIITPSHSAYPYPLLIKQLLLSAPRYGHGREIVSGSQRFSYPEFITRISKLANVLHEAGIGPGDVVAVMEWDTHRYLEAYFAVPMLGAVLHHVNVRLSPEQVVYTMQHAQDQLVLFNDDFLPLLESVADQLPGVEAYIQMSDSAQVVPTDLPVLGEYEKMLTCASSEFEFADFSEDSVATLSFTTGTTGKPKAVYFSHRQIVLHTLVEATTFAAFEGTPLLRSEDVYMPMTPMFHVHAWGVPYVATLLGVKQVYPGRYEAQRLVDLRQQEGVTFSHGVPTVLQMILDCQDADLSGWKLVTGGSAPNQALADRLAERGVLLYTGYGMSETCPLLTLTHLTTEQTDRRLQAQSPDRCRTGMPIPLVELKVLGTDGASVAANDSDSGEIQVRAPWLTQGYYSDPERGEALWEGGWLHTGDVATLDTHGQVQIRDRIKDIIKTGGEWLSSLELENIISRHHGVDKVAVVGVPDPRWGERPMALIVSRQPVLNISDLKGFLMKFVDTGEISKWAIPETFIQVDQIPLTSVGKFDKKRIRAEYASCP